MYNDKFIYLLKKLGFEVDYHIYPSRNRISIKSIEKYQREIDFLHLEKKEKLDKIIKNTPRVGLSKLY